MNTLLIDHQDMHITKNISGLKLGGDNNVVNSDSDKIVIYLDVNIHNSKC
jgi:hypothetical protein